MKIPSHNLGIAHLGRHFWDRVAAENPRYCSGSVNGLLLCLNDEGKMLTNFLLPKEDATSGWLEMQARVCLARSSGASTVVRVQKNDVDYADPLQINCRATEALYDAINLHDLYLIEVIVPYYMDFDKKTMS